MDVLIRTTLLRSVPVGFPPDVAGAAAWSVATAALKTPHAPETLSSRFTFTKNTRLHRLQRRLQTPRASADGRSAPAPPEKRKIKSLQIYKNKATLHRPRFGLGEQKQKPGVQRGRRREGEVLSHRWRCLQTRFLTSSAEMWTPQDYTFSAPSLNVTEKSCI